MKPQDMPFRPAVGLVRLILLWWLASASLPLRAQTWDEVTKNRNGEYLHAEGTGPSFDAADRMALARLISQIWVAVTVRTDQLGRQVTTGTEVRSEEVVQDEIQTYSEATLTNTHSVTLTHSDTEWRVGRWIRRSELDKVFQARRDKVKAFVQTALKAEGEGRADDALCHYYWGLLLLETLPLPGSVTFEADGKQHVLAVWIPERINAVLRDLRAEVVSRDGKDFVLLFTFRGRPVSSLDYRFFDGQVESRVCSARDGRGVLDLIPGYEPQQLEIAYEVEFKDRARNDHEVEAAMRSRAMSRATGGWTGLAKTKIDPKPTAAAAAAAPPSAPDFPKAAAPDPGQARACHDRMERILRSVSSGTYAGADDCFTAEGLDIFRRLISYGRARLAREPQLRYFTYANSIICRGVQMSFSPPHNVRRSFSEDIVFTFDADGLVCNIAFGLGSVAEADIMGRSAWPEAVRQAILHFLENYKTAFALKRLDYIGTIFADDAFIMTGTVLRRTAMSLDEYGMSQMGKETYRKNTFTKQTYLRHLERCFASNEFINIHFSDNSIRRVKENVYDIQIAQDYYSTHYGDHGYLFLQIDMTDPDEPLIKIRTWQPERAPGFGIYSSSDF